MSVPVSFQYVNGGIPAGLNQRSETLSDSIIGFVTTASRSEFYAAKSAGERADLTLEVMADSYNLQEHIVITDGNPLYNGRFRVVRVYSGNPHRLTLSLARR